MKKNELPVTIINLEDFCKLTLKGYEHRKHYYDKDGVRIKEDKAFIKVPDQYIDGVKIESHYHSVYNFSKVCWEEVDLVEKVKEEIEFIKRDYPEYVDKYICLAVYKDIPSDELEKAYKDTEGQLDMHTGHLLTEEQRREFAFSNCLYTYSYLDKYTTILGAQTYLMRFGVDKLYSIRDYYETRDDYFRIPKKQTKAIYLIKF